MKLMAEIESDFAIPFFYSKYKFGFERPFLNLDMWMRLGGIRDQDYSVTGFHPSEALGTIF